MNATEPKLNEVHCSRCGRFLGYELVMLGIVQFKCPKCKEWTTISNFPEEVDKPAKKRYARKRQVDKVV